MQSENLKARTKRLAIDIGHFTLILPLSIVNKQYIGQIIRSSGSVAANYRAASRAKSNRDFLNKLKICEEEADETQLWLEMLAEFNREVREKIIPLYKECDELVAIFVASIKTIRKKIDIEAAKDKEKQRDK